MAEPIDTTEGAGPDGPRRRFNPLLALVAIAVVAFVVAYFAFRSGSKTSTNVGANGQVTTPTTAGSGCAPGNPDSSYTVSMASDPNPPRAEGTTFHLTLLHAGQSVTGAKVCVSADMTEMHHEGINDVGKETSKGKYDVTLNFGMRGPYRATVVINEPGKPPGTTTFTFQVT